MDVRLPDGTLLQNVPDGMSRADLTSKLAANGYDVSKLAPPPQQSMGDQVKNYIYNHAFFGASPQDIANAGAGAVKGASEIGSTLMMPAQWLGIPQTVASGLRYLAGPVDANHHAGVVAQAADALAHGLDPTEGATQTIPGLITGAPAPNIDAARRQEVTQGLQMMGADPNSTAFTLGKMGAEIAGTAGAGKAVTAGIKAVPAVAKLAAPLLPAIESGGFSLGKTGGNWLANALLRATGGAVSGGATAGLINPNTAAQGAEIGAISPLAVRGVGKLGSAAYRNVKGLLQPIINPEATAAKMLAGASGTDAPTLAKVLAQPQELVPGSTPTTAQVIATPQAVAMEKAMRNNPDFAVKYENLMNANNAARLNAINGVAGNPGELEAAQAARDAAAKKLYEQAFSHPLPASLTAPAIDTASQRFVPQAKSFFTPENNLQNAQQFKNAIEALGKQYTVNIEQAPGGSTYATVLKNQLTKAGEVAKNRTPIPLDFKARFADHGQYWGGDISVDPVTGNSVDDAVKLFRFEKGGERANPPITQFNRSQIDPRDSVQYVYPVKLNTNVLNNGGRDYWREGARQEFNPINPAVQEGSDPIAAANQLYGQAYGAQPTITPELQSQMDALMQRPAMKSAIQDAKQIALNQGLPLDNASSVQGLHYAKMSLDDQISRALRAGDNNLARSLMDTRSSLLDVLGNLSPDYRQAMATYADMSKPVNTMQVGREMQKNLWNKSLNSASDPALTFNNYRGALDKSLRGAEYGINPDAEATLRSVQNDLQRATVSNSFRTPGSDTAYNLNAQPWLSQKIYGPGFTGSGAKAKAIGTGIGTALGVATGHPLAGAGMGAAAMVGLGKVGTQRVNDALSNMLLNPQEAAKALLALKPTERAALSAAMAQKLGQFNNLPVVLGTQ